MKIHCDVIEDIKPLVLDGIASEETVKLYEEHMAECQSCSKNNSVQVELIKSNPTEEVDKKIISNMKNKLRMFYIILILAGIVFGAVTVAREDRTILYNFILLPVIGGLSYPLFKNKWFLLPVLVFTILFMIILVKYLVIGGAEPLTALYSGLMFGGIAAILTAIGGAIIALLNYGLRS